MLSGAKEGRAFAQCHVGQLHERGVRGCSKDKAVHWYQLAAEQGHAKAEFFLGMCNLKGAGGLEKSVPETLRPLEVYSMQIAAICKLHSWLLGVLYADGNAEYESHSGKRILKEHSSC